MDNRINMSLNYMRFTRISRSRFGEKGSIPIDQTPAQSFNIDPATGRPMSDVQRLTKIQDNYALQTQFSQLKEFKSDFLPSDISDTDALKYMVPRYTQLPSELLEHRQNLLKEHLRIESAKAEKAALERQQKEDEEYMNKLRESFINS